MFFARLWDGGVARLCNAWSASVSSTPLHAMFAYRGGLNSQCGAGGSVTVGWVQLGYRWHVFAPGAGAAAPPVSDNERTQRHGCLSAVATVQCAHEWKANLNRNMANTDNMAANTRPPLSEEALLKSASARPLGRTR